MIRSMTAFSRRELVTPSGTLSWEIKSVNQRFLEVTPRLPEAFRDLEMPVRERLRHHLSRGKLECTLRFRAEASSVEALQLNTARVRQLLDAAHRLAALTQTAPDLTPATLLAWPGIIEITETDPQPLLADALALFDETLAEFIVVREREGRSLRQLLEQRLDLIAGHVVTVREAIPQILQAARQRLEQRLGEWRETLQPERLEQEVVLLTHKMDVEEELDRLTTHLAEIRRLLAEGGAQGRRLDFLMQELNREANTLGSKSVSANTTQAAVELKVLIEQMREQVQNIE